MAILLALKMFKLSVAICMIIEVNIIAESTMSTVAEGQPSCCWLAIALKVQLWQIEDFVATVYKRSYVSSGVATIGSRRWQQLSTRLLTRCGKFDGEHLINQADIGAKNVRKFCPGWGWQLKQRCAVATRSRLVCHSGPPGATILPFQTVIMWGLPYMAKSTWSLSRLRLAIKVEVHCGNQIKTCWPF